MVALTLISTKSVWRDS